MIYVGIDVAKETHDCFILSSSGEVAKDVFTITNDKKGFTTLVEAIPKVDKDKIKVGLEATGHYNLNLLNFLSANNFQIIVLNPLQTNIFRKAQTLRKIKTDRIDAKIIAQMIMTGNFKTYSSTSYHLQELKSLTRHKYRLRDNLSKYRVSLTRIMDNIFPELESLVYSLNQKSTLALLKAFPSKEELASAHLTSLTNLLKKSSRGRYGRDKALLIRETAKNSIGTSSRATSFELLQTISFIEIYTEEIAKIDKEIKLIMEKIQSPIISIPGVSYGLGSIILAEIGDINNFASPAKLLAFAGLEPSVHQSGTYNATQNRMVKRGSIYLRWALLQAARLIAMRDQTFKAYYEKKRAEGKHYFVVLSHVARKLVRVIHHLLSNNLEFIPQR